MRSERVVKFASELLDLERQMRDERPGAGDFCLDPRRIRNGLVAIALGQISAPFSCRKRGFQKGDIIRRGSHDGGLEADRDNTDSATKALQCNAFQLSDRGWSPGFLGVPPVDPG